MEDLVKIVYLVLQEKFCKKDNVFNTVLNMVTTLILILLLVKNVNKDV